MYAKKQSKQEILEKTKVFSLGIIILSLLFLRAGIGLFMEYQRNYKKAIRYMPELTTARIQQLLCETNEKDAKNLADELIRSNKNISEVYGVKAEIDYENKHYEEMIRYTRKEIRNRKYQKEVYEDYIEKLAEILEKKQQTSDMKEIQRYLKELVWIQEYIEKINKYTNPIAIHLKDDPKIKLDDNYQNYLNEINNYYNRHY